MTPSYAIKKGVRYRYYVSCVLPQGRKEAAGTVKRVAADDIEQTVLAAVAAARPANSAEHDPFRSSIADEVSRTNAPTPGADVAVRERIERVILRAQSVDIEFAETEFRPPEHFSVPWTHQTFRRRREVIAPSTEVAAGQQPIRWLPRTRLISAISRARRWLEEIVSGRSPGIDAIAARDGLNERTARMTLSLAFLAPDIVKAALEGTLPRGLGASRLMELPDNWAEQRRVLGLAASA